MTILTTSGRTALAIAVRGQPLHLAWGTGDVAWDTTPEAEPIGATGLVAELGRRAFNTVQYVVTDAEGAIITPSGRYSVSGTPTNMIYVAADFDYTDASSAIIREVGVFLGTQLVAGLPAGQVYFEPGDVADPGTLFALQRVPRITRSPSVRQGFEYVLKF